MAKSKEEAIQHIRKKLEKNILLRAEINNPYFEKYIDEAVVAIVDEIFEGIEDYHKELVRKLNREARMGRV